VEGSNKKDDKKKPKKEQVSIWDRLKFPKPKNAPRQRSRGGRRMQARRRYVN
jgi:hypothetical protein